MIVGIAVRALMVAAIVVLVACSSGLSGTYEAPLPGGGIARIEFESGNRAVSIMGPGVEGMLTHSTVGDPAAVVYSQSCKPMM